MKTTQLIAVLMKSLWRQGNVEVVIDDADTGWLLAITQVQDFDGKLTLRGEFSDCVWPKRDGEGV